MDANPNMEADGNFDPGELKPGCVLDGRFKVASLTKRGGMACIYRAEDLATGRTVALKVPLLRFESDPLLFTRFQREEEIAARLDHPFILKAIQSSAPKSRPYLAMDFIEGETLDEVIARSRPVPEPEAVRIASQICEALEHLRLRGVAHRDLKPENVIVCGDGTIRLFDFGIAKSAWLRRLTLGSLTPALGTPDYLSPEQVLAKGGDHRSDIYSLGAILYEMLTGRVPFEGDAPFVVMNARVTGDPPAPRALNPRLTPVVEEIVLHAMARKPQERYATAAEMKAELDDYECVKLTGRCLRLKPPSPGRGGESPWIGRGIAISVIVISLQLAAFGLLFWYFKTHAHR